MPYLQLYSFRGVDGEVLEVYAADEQKARTDIMQKRWGDPPQGWGHWVGFGLALWDIEFQATRPCEPIKRRA